MKIGLFDSGIGGLTVLASLLKLLPNEEYLYYSDTVHVPFGTKTNDEILSYTEEGVDFLCGKGCDIVCIACNTATSIAAEKLRKKENIPIVGIEPAIKPAVSEVRTDGRILVLATPVTVRERKLASLIERVDREHLVDMLALPLLPSFAEKGDFDSGDVRTYLSECFEGTDTTQYHRIVLGCTHFIHYESLFKEYFPENVIFLDGCEGTARNVRRIAMENELQSSECGSIKYFNAGKIITDEKTLSFYQSILERLK